MSQIRLSEAFYLNTLFLRAFGAWPTDKFANFHKIYSSVCLFITYFLYFITLTVSLYLASSIEMLIRELISYVTLVVAITKVLMILVKRKDILDALTLLDSGFFMADDYCKRRINKTILIYKKCHIFYIVLCNGVFSTQVVLPVILHGFLGTRIFLPFVEFSFLSDESRDKYFVILYIYQSVSAYTHMTHEINIDAFMFGLIFIAISHVKLINYKLRHFKISKTESEYEIKKFVEILRHYETVLRFCKSLQKILSITMFFQFCSSAALICTIMCGLLTPSTIPARIFMVTYLAVMIGQLFMPGWLGTQLALESQELVFAAYNAQWIPRSEPFKRSLRLFVERANTPITLTGLKMFQLSLGTFTAIMKTAYSLFTLVRNVQARQNN